MKKYLKVLLVLFVSFIFMPNVFAAESVTIESITLDSKSDNTEIANEATYEGLSIKFDIKFNEVNDYAKYKIIINNQSDTDYEISENSNFDDSEYITYEYNYEDNNKIAKKNTKTTMYITIKYNKEVPEELFTDGSFIETNNLEIDLGNNTIEVPDTIKNPMTGDNLFINVLVLFITIGISLILYKTTKKKQFLSLLIISVALLPISIYAIGKLQIKVESKVEIESQYDYWCHIIFYNGTQYNVFKYKKGMTWQEYYESDDPNIVKIEDGCVNGLYSCNSFNILYKRVDSGGIQIGFGTDYQYYPGGVNRYDEDGNPYYIGRRPNPDLKIVSKDEFCYGYIPD